MSRYQLGESGVYKITNLINQKDYVGVTKNLHCRWQEHQRDSLKDNKPLYKAIRKYGIKNFKFEILCLTPDDPEILFELEIFFIADQNTYIGDGKGYNLNRGGGGNFNPSSYTRNKMSIARKNWHKTHEANFKGCHHTDEWKKENSLKLKGNTYSLGRKRTKEAKKNISAAKSGKYPDHFTVKIECPHCGKKVLLCHQRFHFDNCRFKGQSRMVSLDLF
jgi:group I intron endonuclease